MSNIVGGIDISRWATGAGHEESVAKQYNEIKGFISSSSNSSYSLENKIDNYIQNNPVVKKAGGSPITGKMILQTASKYNIDPVLIMAISHIDSHYGVLGKAVGTKNPGNWGNDDTGATRTLSSWEEGVDKIGMQLSRYRNGKEGSIASTGGNYMPTNYYISPIDLISPATKAQQEREKREKELVKEANLKPDTTSKSIPVTRIEYLQSLKNNAFPKELNNEETNEVPELYVSVFDTMKELPNFQLNFQPKFVTPSFYKTKKTIKYRT